MTVVTFLAPHYTVHYDVFKKHSTQKKEIIRPRSKRENIYFIDSLCFSFAATLYLTDHVNPMSLSICTLSLKDEIEMRESERHGDTVMSFDEKIFARIVSRDSLSHA